MDTTASLRNPHAAPAECERFAAFREAIAAEGLSSATLACYASDWMNISEYAHRTSGRRFRADRYAPDDFQLLRADLIARGVSPSTMNRRLAFLRRYLAFAAQRQPAILATASAFAAIPFQAAPRRTTVALTRRQDEALRAAAARLGTSEAAIVTLMLGTGLRAADVAGLLRGDVSGPPGAPESLRVRGERAKTVMLPARTASALATHLAVVPVRADAFVFASKSGGPLGEAGVAAAVARVADAAGVEATPRTLRHTFAVRYLAEHREDVDGLTRALGHVSPGAVRAYREEAASGTPLATVTRWEEIEPEIEGGVRRRTVTGSQTEIMRTLLSPGGRIERHSHPEEQITTVLSGRVRFAAPGTSVTLVAGSVVRIPPGVSHEFTATGSGSALLLSAFSPARRARDGARA